MHAAMELSSLARIHNASGEPARALGYARESVSLLRCAGEISSLGTALLIHGDVLRALHRDADALALYEEGITIAHDVGAARNEFWGVMARAEALYALGDYPAAAASFARGLAVARRLASRKPFTSRLEGIAILAHAVGRHREAAMLLSAAISLQGNIGTSRRSEGRTVLDAARRVLGDEAFAAACAAGEAMRLDDAISEADALLDTVAHSHVAAKTRGGN
jgi:tetratricopeptide (TPR) repeat protein